MSAPPADVCGTQRGELWQLSCPNGKNKIMNMFFFFFVVKDCINQTCHSNLLFITAQLEEQSQEHELREWCTQICRLLGDLSN